MVKIRHNLNKALIVASIFVANNALADDWQFQLEPYIMATAIEGDIGVGRATGLEIDVNFDTILENLDSGAMVHFEAHHVSGWGVIFDYGFMDLSGKAKNDKGSYLKARVRQGVLELHATYRNKLSNGYLDYYAGVRWWDNDMDLNGNIAILPGEGFSVEVESDWYDPVVGVRWLRDINDDFTFLAQLDVGGFGIESDFTYSIQSGVTYQISELMTLDVKYKASLTSLIFR